MRVTKEQNKKHQKQKINKGITLVSLVITIIIMLILVTVTVTMTVNGGLFDFAGKAVRETQNEIDYKQKLAKGRIKKGDKWYASIDDYYKNKPMGITTENTIYIGIDKNYNISTSTPVTEQINAKLSGIAGKVIYHNENEDVITVDDTGLITAIKKGTSKIKTTVTYDGDLYEDECTVNVIEYSNLWVNSNNRDKIGYTSEISKLVIPKYFYNETDGRWYKPILDIYAFANQTNIKEVTIMDSETIGMGVFQGCTNLTKVKLPDNLTLLNLFAFDGCSSLTSVGPIGSGASVEIPSSVREFKGAVFRNCKGLTSVTIPEGVVTMGETFKDCSALKSVTLPASLRKTSNTFNWCSSLTEVVIPYGLEELGISTFSRCNLLESITIPASVKSIGDEAFFNCGLKNINYTGTIAQWEAITKGSNWNFAIPATEVVCTDGTVSLK